MGSTKEIEGKEQEVSHRSKNSFKKETEIEENELNEILVKNEQNLDITEIELQNETYE